MLSRKLIVGVVFSLALTVPLATGELRGELQPEMRWMPVAADANLVCLPGEGPCGETEIMVSGWAMVTMFLEVRGWDPDLDGNPTLGAYQGTVDSRSYKGGLAPGEIPGHPGNPGTLPGWDIYEWHCRVFLAELAQTSHRRTTGVFVIPVLGLCIAPA